MANNKLLTVIAFATFSFIYYFVLQGKNGRVRILHKNQAHQSFPAYHLVYAWPSIYLLLLNGKGYKVTTPERKPCKTGFLINHWEGWERSSLFCELKHLCIVLQVVTMKTPGNAYFSQFYSSINNNEALTFLSVVHGCHH